MSILSVGTISLDSTFKATCLYFVDGTALFFRLADSNFTYSKVRRYVDSKYAECDANIEVSRLSKLHNTIVSMHIPEVP